MHKYEDYPKNQREEYESMLRVIGSLSRLFSENEAPFLDSRIAENLYCRTFNAENKGRDDSSIDAKFKNVGIGIKTFVGSGGQKIAEFNKDILEFKNLKALAKAKRISELRNQRIEFTKRLYGVTEVKYHCIIREKGKMKICEFPMDKVQIEELKITKESQKSIHFTDGKNQYNFNVSKSVLLKKFSNSRISAELAVEILTEPFSILHRILTDSRTVPDPKKDSHATILLPLFIMKNGIKKVPERSGLNQWNAGGRARDPDEVYIPIKSTIRKKFPDFFPPRNVKFTLKLPNGNKISAKICQDNDKALMSDPNKALGQWILREVLELKERKLLTYKILQEVGIDSVMIRKNSEMEYEIDFREEGEYDQFEAEQLDLETGDR